MAHFLSCSTTLRFSTFRISAGSRQDATLLVYPQLLRRAIDNILRNAIRYAPPVTEILLNCKVDDDLQQVIVEILDCGPGVPEFMLADIFRPFFRTAPGRESGSGGTGLGLSIATEAVRLHDGTNHGTKSERWRPARNHHSAIANTAIRA
jgi:two-component system sensor histidine kinase CpxA